MIAVQPFEIGIFAFGVGEHHRPDFAVSSPQIVLAAEVLPEVRAALT